MQKIYGFLTPKSNEKPSIVKIVQHVFGYNDQQMRSLGLHVGVIDSQFELTAFLDWAFKPASDGKSFVFTEMHREYLG